MTDPHIISILTLSFLLGLRHALDADHLIAVSTMVCERRGFWHSSLIGIFWGVGHTLALLVVAIIMITLAIQIPKTIALMLEFIVALMLIILGGRVLWKIQHGATFHIHVHSHNDRIHIHPHIHEGRVAHQHPDHERHHHLLSFGKMPLVVGLVHGMAGSAALMLMVLTAISSRSIAILYVAMFGLGSIGGMLIMSTLVGIPLAATTKNRQLHRAIQITAGVISIGFGLFLTWQIGVEKGLFL